MALVKWHGILGCKLGWGVDNEHAVMRAENREIFGQFAMNLYLTLDDSIENDHQYKLSLTPKFFFEFASEF